MGRTPGPESDLWSLGVLLYAAVEGSTPFRQETPLSTLRAVVDEELPPPLWAGPLAPVIEGLLRKEPAERMSAEQAERDLRLVAAGGTPTAAGAQVNALPYVPSHPSATEAATAPPTMSRTADDVAPSAGTTVAPGAGRDRRAVVVLIVGLLALALAIGGIAWVLANRDKGGEGANGGSSAGATGSTGATDGTDGSSGGQDGSGGNGSSDGDDGGNSGSGSGGDGGSGGDDGGDDSGGSDDGGSGDDGGSSDPPAEQKVTVTVSADRDTYEAPCPGPDGEAPAFTGKIEVTVVPAKVEYRWVSEGGPTDWATLTFASGGDIAQSVHHGEPTGNASRTGEVVLEVRGPEEVESDPVAYTVTCDKGGTDPVTDPPEDDG